MSDGCPNCLYTKRRVNELIKQYEDLIQTKDHEILCSHRIMRDLQAEVRALNDKVGLTGLAANQQENRLVKMVSAQDETIEYLKQREVKLIGQLKNSEKEIFRLLKDKEDYEIIHSELQTERPKTLNTPTKQSQHPESYTLGKDNSSMEKILKESIICPGSQQSVKLRVAQDQLKVTQIKHKIALLKCVELVSLR